MTADTNYQIVHKGDQLIIHRRRSQREWGHFIFYGSYGLALVLFPLYLFYKSKHIHWNTSAVLSAGLFACIILWGLTRVVIAIEVIVTPTRALFVIDKREGTIAMKLPFFRKAVFQFSAIKEIQLSGHDTIVKDLNRGQVYPRRLYYHQLQFLLSNGKTQKVHRFLYRKLFMGTRPGEESFEVRTNAKNIAQLLSTETGIPYHWLGTKKKEA